MSYGLEIKNSNNRIIIDDIYENYQLHSIIYITTTADTYNSASSFVTYYSTRVPINAPANSLILISPTVYDSNILYIPFENTLVAINTATDKFVAKTVKLLIMLPVSQLVVDNSGYGLQVYNDSGIIRYNLNKKIVRFEQVFSKSYNQLYSYYTNLNLYLDVGNFSETWSYPVQIDEAGNWEEHIYIEGFIYNAATTFQITQWVFIYPRSSYEVQQEYIYGTNNYLTLGVYE